MDSRETPAIGKSSFACPYCGCFTTQNWIKLSGEYIPQKFNPLHYFYQPTSKQVEGEKINHYAEKLSNKHIQVIQHENTRRGTLELINLNISTCLDCEAVSVWKHDILIFPEKSVYPKPHNDMPEDVKDEYEEAISVLNTSPRSAMALLRLATQKLSKNLGQSENLNTAIKKMVQDGLSVKIQKTLDILRVTGNHAVHPGQMDLKDNKEMAVKLLNLLNLIVNTMISEPKEINAIYDSLPESDRETIEKRDNPKKS